MPASPETANDLMTVFSNTVSAGFDALTGAVNGVFALMIALVVALTGIQWALSANREVLAAGFGKVLLIGFFAYIINDWQGLSQTLWSGFVQLGLTAGGGSLSQADFLNPGEILRQGWQIVKALGEAPAPVANPIDVAGNLTDALILGLAMIGIMLSFAILAIQIIVTLLEFKIVTLGGFVLLPFGIWSKSAFLAERPLGYVVSSGLKVLALAIVISGARSVFDQLQPSAAPDLYEALAILAAAILLAMLAIFIPNLAAALVTGGPALGAGGAITGALALGGAGALTAAGAAGAGALMGGGASRISAAARAAAGAGQGRPPTPPMPPSPAPPRPSNDNPSRRPGGPPVLAAGETSRPAVAPDGEGVASIANPSASAGATTTRSAPAAARSPEAITGEARQAQADFTAAARGGRASPPSTRRSAALQAYFVANAGRSLLPGSETSGTLSPQLKPEEP